MHIIMLPSQVTMNTVISNKIIVKRLWQMTMKSLINKTSYLQPIYISLKILLFLNKVAVCECHLFLVIIRMAFFCILNNVWREVVLLIALKYCGM